MENLTAAQKVDSNIRDIIGTAPSVAIYRFGDQGNWVKSDQEGSLLVCERNSHPKVCIVILNQLKPENFVEYMDPGVSLQRKGVYLLYKSPMTPHDCKAIWFYNENDCVQIFEILKETLDPKSVGHLQRGAPVQQQPVTTSSSKASSLMGGPDNHGTAGNSGTAPGRDILKILSSAASTRNKGIGVQDNMGQGAAAMVGRHQSTSVPVENLFKSVDSAQRTGAGDGDDRYKISTTSGGGMQGIFPNQPSVIQGKGRGRPVSPGEVVPALQRLLNKDYGKNDQQSMPSAFSNVSARPKPISGGHDMLNEISVGNSMDSTMRMDASKMSVLSPLPQSGSVLQQELLTPADVAAFNGRDLGDQIYRSAPNTPFSPQASSDQNTRSTSNSASANLPLGQAEVERMRQVMVHLLEHDRDFVDVVERALAKHRLRGDRNM